MCYVLCLMEANKCCILTDCLNNQKKENNDFHITILDERHKFPFIPCLSFLCIARDRRRRVCVNQPLKPHAPPGELVRTPLQMVKQLG